MTAWADSGFADHGDVSTARSRVSVQTRPSPAALPCFLRAGMGRAGGSISGPSPAPILVLCHPRTNDPSPGAAGSPGWQSTWTAPCSCPRGALCRCFPDHLAPTGEGQQHDPSTKTCSAGAWARIQEKHGQKIRPCCKRALEPLEPLLGFRAVTCPRALQSQSQSPQGFAASPGVREGASLPTAPKQLEATQGVSLLPLSKQHPHFSSEVAQKDWTWGSHHRPQDTGPARVTWKCLVWAAGESQTTMLIFTVTLAAPKTRVHRHLHVCTCMHVPWCRQHMCNRLITLPK